MTIVQRRYFIQSPKLLLELRASEMLVNVKSVQRKAGRQLSRTSRRLEFLSCHSGPVIAGGPCFPRPVRKEWKARMQIQPFLRRWPILLSVLCAKDGHQIPNLKPSKPPCTREEQGIGF